MKETTCRLAIQGIVMGSKESNGLVITAESHWTAHYQYINPVFKGIPVAVNPQQ